MARNNLDLTASTPKDERGSTATEYGLLVGFIALAIVVGVGLFGTAVGGFFTDLASAVDALIF